LQNGNAEKGADHEGTGKRRKRAKIVELAIATLFATVSLRKKMNYHRYYKEKDDLASAYITSDPDMKNKQGVNGLTTTSYGSGFLSLKLCIYKVSLPKL
jgi:hypothetical protein